MIVFSLMLTGISGCATTTTKSILQTIDSETIQAVIEDDSKTLPIEPGDEISISTTKRMRISSRNAFYVEMVVIDVDTTRIRGEVDLACCDLEPRKEGITSNTVEVKLEDIIRISYTEEQVQTVDSEIGAQIKRDSKKIVKEAPVQILGTALAIGFWIIIFSII